MVSAGEVIKFARANNYDITEAPKFNYNIAVSSGILTICEQFDGTYYFFNRENFIIAQMEFPGAKSEPFNTTLF